MDAHLCQGGIIKGKIRKYASFFCSCCNGHSAVEIDASESYIDEHNRMVVTANNKANNADYYSADGRITSVEGEDGNQRVLDKVFESTEDSGRPTDDQTKNNENFGKAFSNSSEKSA